MARLNISRDGSTAYAHGVNGHLAVSADTTRKGFFVIRRFMEDGKVIEDGFANHEAAIAQAEWRVDQFGTRHGIYD